MGSSCRRVTRAITLAVVVGLFAVGLPGTALAANSQVTINDVTVTEGSSGTTTATFTVTAAPRPSPGDTVTVNFATADSSAVAPADYAATSGSVTMTRANPSRTVSVTVVGDTVDETSETLLVSLSNLVATGGGSGSITDGQGVGTITDDDATPTISIDDVPTNEGDVGTTNATFTVSLSTASGQTVAVDYATADDTAVEPGDYTARSGTVVFAAGQVTRPINVPVKGDTTDENNETFWVSLSNPTGGMIADGLGGGTITDDDGPPSVSVNDVTVAEGDAGTTTETFSVSLSTVSGKTVTVDYATSDGTATAPGDYTVTSGSVTIPAGSATSTFDVSVNGDTLNEDDETFTVALSNAGNATISDGTGTSTIADDDPIPSLSVADGSNDESSAASSGLQYTVTLSAASSKSVTVDYVTADGTASAPGDYTPKSGTLTFVPGDTSETVTVTGVDNSAYEFDETVLLDLSGPSNATVLDGQATGTLTNDDAAPSLVVGDVTVTEGTGLFTTATFTVTLAGATEEAAWVDYASADGTATAPGDFLSTSGTLSFAPGDTTETVAITLVADSAFESDEAYTLELSSAVNATIGDGSGAGVITDDDTLPTIDAIDASQPEGNAGTSSLAVPVTLSNPSAFPVTVDFATADGGAVAGSDYTSTVGTLSFAPGDTSELVNVPVGGDTTYEDDESFAVDLAAPSGAILGGQQASGTIANDDALPPASIDDVAVAEGDVGTTTATFTVTLANPSESVATIDWATSDDTAVAPGDYQSGSGTVTFPSGDVSETIDVTVVGDVTVEADQTFTVDLSNATGAAIADNEGVGTIVSDDPVPGISVSDASPLVEGDTGTTVAAFTITLSHPSDGVVTAEYSTTAGTAGTPLDFTDVNGSVSFAPGDTSETVDVSVNGDTRYEADETFELFLSAPSNGLIVDDVGVATIPNDDPQPAVSIDDVTVTEGDAGTAMATFMLTLSAPSGLDASVDWATNDDTALQPGDYQGASGTVTFVRPNSIETVSVQVNGDTLDELDERFDVELTGATEATIADGTGVATVDDDDITPTALTAKSKVLKRTVRASGLLEPAKSSWRVKVTLLKKKGARYVRVASKTVTLRQIRDRDGDTLNEGSYAVSFAKPKPGRYSFKVVFAGDVDHRKGSKTKKFRV